MQKEPDVYISFPRLDGRETVATLCHELRQRQLKATFDARLLSSPHDLGVQIERSIRFATAVVVCIIPPRLIHEDRFMQREIIYAKLTKKPIVYLIFPGVLADGSAPHYSPSIKFYNDAGELDFASGMTQLLTWLNRRNRTASYRMTQDNFFHYLEFLYKQVLSHLDAQIIRPPDNPDFELPVIFAMPNLAANNSGSARAVSEEIFEYFDNFYDSFDYLQNRAILVGPASAGKTTTLMNYARDAVIARLNDPTKPVPLLVSAASWPHFMVQESSMTAWLAAETGLESPAIAQLVGAGQVLLLVDHLHMLTHTDQADLLSTFIVALKQYLEGDLAANTWLPSNPARHNRILLTCRAEQLPALQQFSESCGLVSLLRLNDDQITEYLALYPDLRTALEVNPTLAELCRQPFFLCAFVYAYHDRPELASALQPAADIGSLQTRILNHYIEACYHRLAETPFDLKTIYNVLGELAIESLNDACPDNQYIDSYSVSLGDLGESIGEEANALVNTLRRLRLIVLLQSSDRVAFTQPILRNHFALPVCLEGLQSDDSVTQRHALRIAGQLTDPRTVPLLIDLLRFGQDKKVRREAAAALGKIRYPEAICALIKAFTLDEAWIVRQKAIEALAEFDDPQVIAPIHRALNDPRAEVRCSATRLLVKVSGADALEPLAGMLADEDHGVAWCARHEILRFGDEAIPVLFNLLCEPSDNLRHAAADTLAQMGKKVISPLIHELVQGSPEIKLGVGEALGRIGEPALEPLLYIMKKYDTASVRAPIATVLGEIKHPSSVGPLIELAQDSHPWVRLSAVASLGQVGDYRAIPVLSALLADKEEPFFNERICDLAAQSLLQLGLPEATEIAHNWLAQQNGHDDNS